jgi:hypothetical protein
MDEGSVHHNSTTHRTSKTEKREHTPTLRAVLDLTIPALKKSKSAMSLRGHSDPLAEMTELQ